MYIAEAHTVDGWQTDSNEAEDIRITRAVRLEERVAAARLCAERLALTIPTLVDGMDDAAAEAFAAWPERMFILGRDGRVAYCGGPGPFEFDPAAAQMALTAILAEG